MSIDVVGLCKIRAYTSVAGDIGRTIQIIKDGVILQERVYTASKFLEFYLPGRAKYTVKDLTSGFSQSVIMSAGEYKEVETGLHITTWAGIKRVIDAGRQAEFLPYGTPCPDIVGVDGFVYDNIKVAGLNVYGLNEVDFVCMKGTQGTTTMGPVGSTSGLVVDTQNNFPQDILAMLAVKQIKYQLSNGSSGNVETAFYKNKLFPFSRTEMQGYEPSYHSMEYNTLGHRQYPGLSTDAMRVCPRGATHLNGSFFSSNTLYDFITALGTPNWSTPASNFTGPRLFGFRMIAS